MRWTFLKNIIAKQRCKAQARSDEWAGIEIKKLNPSKLLDVGCGDGTYYQRYVSLKGLQLYGVECNPESACQASACGFTISNFDLNGRWPFPNDNFDAVLCTQVIEHMHNTKLFVMEMRRILRPGGTAIVTTENLCSSLNCAAMIMGYTPFSLMLTCGRYLGNPMGLHYHEKLAEWLPVDHPAYSGVMGHVRVMTLRQAREIFELEGFKIEAHSVGIMPLPDRISRIIESINKNRGHFLNIKAVKI